MSSQPYSDQVHTYDHPAWVNLDSRLGLVFRGTGKTVYHNRHYFDPWWAVADDLILSCLDRPFQAQAQAVIGQLAAPSARFAPHDRAGTTNAPRITHHQ